ncbi:hypothetical protein EDB89DRAFT_2241588 [Lactarius sanguifluus]|nr:hypothetical protein EDB89DRAFT_2241588 [Lactarius sanguifluus]
MSPSVLLFASLDLISRPRSARPYIVVMNAIPRTFFTARTRTTCPRCMQAQREPVVKNRDGGSDGSMLGHERMTFDVGRVLSGAACLIRWYGQNLPARRKVLQVSRAERRPWSVLSTSFPKRVSCMSYASLPASPTGALRISMQRLRLQLVDIRQPRPRRHSLPSSTRSPWPLTTGLFSTLTRSSRQMWSSPFALIRIFLSCMLDDLCDRQHAHADASRSAVINKKRTMSAC